LSITLQGTPVLVGVSSWPLARVVAMRGQLGVVSGAGTETTMVLRLQDGDPGGRASPDPRDATRPGAVRDRLEVPGSAAPVRSQADRARDRVPRHESLLASAAMSELALESNSSNRASCEICGVADARVLEREVPPAGARERWCTVFRAALASQRTVQ
jgi:hypothetical protein